MIRAGMEGGRSTEEFVHVLACAACPRVSSATARGWKAYLVEDEDERVPTVAFSCPACSQRGPGEPL